MKRKIKEIGILINEKIDNANLNVTNYISTENIIQNFGGITNATSVPYSKVTKFNVEDILISNIRPYFKKIWFANISGGCSNDVIVLRSIDVIPKYLFYVLNTEQFINYYVSSCTGTKMPRGSKEALLEWQIDVPPLPLQQHIVNTIGSVDDLIEKIEEKIRSLQLLSSTLYIQNYELNAKDAVYLGNVSQVKTGKLNAEEADENGLYPFFTCGSKELRIDKPAFDCEAIIIAGNGEISVKHYKGKFNAYQRTYVLEPSEYFYLFLKECENSIKTLKNNSQGSVIKFITKSMLENISIKVNDESSVTNRKLGQIYNLVLNYKKQINCLNRMKSLLLKKYFTSL